MHDLAGVLRPCRAYCPPTPEAAQYMLQQYWVQDPQIIAYCPPEAVQYLLQQYGVQVPRIIRDDGLLRQYHVLGSLRGAGGRGQGSRAGQTGGLLSQHHILGSLERGEGAWGQGWGFRGRQKGVKNMFSQTMANPDLFAGRIEEIGNPFHPSPCPSPPYSPAPPGLLTAASSR